MTIGSWRSPARKRASSSLVGAWFQIGFGLLTALVTVFPVMASSSAAVVSFTLINADNGQDIQTIATGAQINLATLGTRNLSIRANTVPATVGSVSFALSGAQIRSHVENKPVYALFGGDTSYVAWTPGLGSYVLTAVPFSSKNATGTAGTSLTVKFSMVDQVPPRVSSLTLIDADTNQEIGELTSASVLNLATLPTRNLSVRANTLPAEVGSVRFGYDGNSNYRIENQTPYTLEGDNPGPDYNPWTPTLGAHAITATAFSERFGAGIGGDSYRVGFKVIDDIPTRIEKLSLVDSKSRQVLVDSLIESQSIEVSQVSTRCLNILATTRPDSIGSVGFVLSGASVSTVENQAPYLLMGDSGERGCLKVGQVSVKATPYELSGLGGKAGDTFVRSFAITSQTSEAALAPSSIPAGLIPAAWDLAKITGKSYTVSTLQAFNSALSQALPGDGILISAGTHDWGSMTVTGNGTSEKPIVIRSSGGPVIFTGGSSLTIRGSHVHVQGLSFHGSAGGIRILGSSSSRTEGVRLSMIHCKRTGNMCLNVDHANFSRLDHSLIEESTGKSIYVGNSTRSTRIDHNLMRNIAKSSTISGGNAIGGETIQIGSGAYGTVQDQLTKLKAGALPRTNALVDHNIFQNAQGEGEMIGLKSQGAKIVYNVIVDAALGYLSFRSGHHNLAYGNVFRNTQAGMVVHGTSPKIIHNLIVDPRFRPGIQITTGSDQTYMTSGSPLPFTRYITTRGGLIQNNSVITTSRVTTVQASFTEYYMKKVCSPDGTIDCDLGPFRNLIKGNLFVNRRGGSTVSLGSTQTYTSTFAADNVFDPNSPNTYALSSGSVLGNVPQSIMGHFKPAASTDVGRLDALAEFVWSAPQNQCLRISQPGNLDGSKGAIFEPGACEGVGEDSGAAWMNWDLADPAVIADQSQIIPRIKAMPPAALPKLPAPM